MSDWHRLEEVTDELHGRGIVPVHVGGRDVCLVLHDGEIHAFDDACPHRRWPLHLGTLDGPVLQCRAHTWEWDVRTGELQRMRAPECLVLHEARERDGAVEIRIADDAPPARELSELWRARHGAAGRS
ncbi:Rieske (2Fe-2S) protein [Paraconexibacter algicola]|uniref:(2Fe-2S)-binding protein n=1 Tax=Paraconexibacter algicola TaxID=2133960 RepID=A0A2T4ULA6_9ACTN|nr:Rieske 2Fe-2S domain-containing protein [Paraconexibacter algicola]PTL60017.1 (2Fe-2S)-binding protein [Paraconexibacter algicola]